MCERDFFAPDSADGAGVSVVRSRERRETFAKLVLMNGRRLHVFRESSAACEMAVRVKELSDWLVSLPRPCGVFAANDNQAVTVLSACQAVGLSVPDEIAVVGVDDIPALCDSATPTCSSVRRDNDRAGELAGELLHDLMSGTVGEGLCRKYGVLRLTRRESTRRIPGMDKRVARAIEFIRRHACDGIGPSEVFSEMGCSRSLANLRFRQNTGHSILDEIHSVRLEKVKDLLSRKDIVLSALPDFSGYASLSDLRRVFRQRIGCTIVDYRRQFAR